MILNNDSKETILVRLDLGINPHDHLDFQHKFKEYLVWIKNFHGYITQYHFQKLMAQLGVMERTSKENIKKMIDNKWLGSVSLGKYNVLYLKRKSTICLSQRSTNGDLKTPTIYQSLRSIMLAEIMVNNNISSYPREIFTDVYVIRKKEKNRIIILDIKKRKEADYLRLLVDIFKEVKEEFISIHICGYGDRYKVMEKIINKARENTLLHGTTLLEEEWRMVKPLKVDILKFFGNKEPLLR